jgi:hypothetical protein
MDRAKTTVKRDSLGDAWSYQNTHDIGQRNGTTEDKSRQNDRNYTTHEQYHTLGECVDGKHVFSEELALAGRKNTNLYNSMYYSGGEVKNQSKVDNNEEKPVYATVGENKGWSERSIYFMRCAAERNLAFAEKLWHVLTWPLDIVETCMVDLEREYKASVRANSAGPNRARIDGRWQAAPLVGQEAIDHIKRVGVGTLKGRHVNKNVNVLIGATWHKLLLNKKHMDALEDAILWRKGIAKLDIGGELVEEQFEQTYEGLPREYVLNTYGRKA